MKTIFKPLGLAAAVAAVTAGYAGVAGAQALPSVANNGLGDLALVPYYTTEGDFVTGVHIINTSAQTQVIKLRLRRATDSMDALDFNLIMSPHDEWTGFLEGEEGGDVSWNTADTTCTAPEINGKAVMSPIYRAGADSGYIEVIAMGAPASETYPIAVAAKHTVDGVPKDCAAVATNFLSGGVVGSAPGNVNTALTVQLGVDAKTGAPTYLPTNYSDSGNVLKVSYFIRDAGAGLEFGNDAVHIADFETRAPMMTNQEFGTFSGDMSGFDFPDLNGGVPLENIRDRFQALRQFGVLGVTSVLNDWSNNPANGVNTDWVVTLPGQYTMLALPLYLSSGSSVAGLPNANCTYDSVTIAGTKYTETGGLNPVGVAARCDTRDIPVRASFKPYDREEFTPAPGTGSLVLSPSLPGSPEVTLFAREVNVVQWGPKSVMKSPEERTTKVNTGIEQPFGWAQVSVTSKFAGTVGQRICDWTGDFNPGDPTFNPFGKMLCVTPATGAVPMIGFVAWERSFDENPDANYGRIVEHSFTTSTGS